MKTLNNIMLWIVETTRPGFLVAFLAIPPMGACFGAWLDVVKFGESAPGSRFSCIPSFFWLIVSLWIYWAWLALGNRKTLKELISMPSEQRNRILRRYEE